MGGPLRVERSDDHVDIDARVFDFAHDAAADVQLGNVFDFDQVVNFAFYVEELRILEDQVDEREVLFGLEYVFDFASAEVLGDRPREVGRVLTFEEIVEMGLNDSRKMVLLVVSG